MSITSWPLNFQSAQRTDDLDESCVRDCSGYPAPRWLACKHVWIGGGVKA